MDICRKYCISRLFSTCVAYEHNLLFDITLIFWLHGLEITPVVPSEGSEALLWGSRVSA